MGGMTTAVATNRTFHLLSGLILADPTFLTLKAEREVYHIDIAKQHSKMLNMWLGEVVAEARSRRSNRSS